MQRLRDCLKAVFRAVGELISTMLPTGLREFWEQYTHFLPVSVHLVVIAHCLWLRYTAAFSLDKIQEWMTVLKSQPGLESLVYVAVEFKQIKLCRCILVHMIHVVLSSGHRSVSTHLKNISCQQFSSITLIINHFFCDDRMGLKATIIIITLLNKLQMLIFIAESTSVDTEELLLKKLKILCQYFWLFYSAGIRTREQSDDPNWVMCP